VAEVCTNSAEYRCCHGSPATGHSATCPYDKGFYGPGGVQIKGSGRGIDFHAMNLKHGENSAYARNLRANAEKREG
jgi:hypothetical protein